MIQTILTKSMGKLEEWADHASIASSLGYNMLHMTPIQELGESNSAYSIYDHLSVSSVTIPTGTFEDRKSAVLKEFEKITKEQNLLFMGDVVWNHCANNAPWLADHPEAGYNLQNSPHLKVPFPPSSHPFTDRIRARRIPHPILQRNHQRFLQPNSC